MGTNPFRDENGQFFVLVNDNAQYSIWPAFAEIPAGWRPVFGAAVRHECLSYVEENWTDMRLVNLHVSLRYPPSDGKTV